MIRKMYDTAKVCVKSMNSMSEFKSYVGMKQGEPFSPLLFIIFINDLANDLLRNGISTFNLDRFQMFMLLFAYNTVLFVDTLEELQILLDNLHEYCCKRNISVNITKTKSMVLNLSIDVRTSIFSMMAFLTKLLTHLHIYWHGTQIKWKFLIRLRRH